LAIRLPRAARGIPAARPNPRILGGLIEAAGAKSLGERCAEPLGRDVIHSVTNPLGRLTAATRAKLEDKPLPTRNKR
jgi:hypothetical protein